MTTNTNTMTIHELIEAAVLDTAGLLTETELEAFESAFAAAPVELRAQVRAEQARLCEIALLPGPAIDAEPSTELRERVLESVRAAIADERVAEPVIARVGAQTPKAQAHAAGRAALPAHQPRLRNPRRVNRVWRAAAIGLGAATIGLGGVVQQLNATYNSVDATARIGQLYEEIGAPFIESTLFDARTQRVTLASTVASDRADPVAAVWSNPEWETARLFVKNLVSEADAERYRLVVLDDEGNIVREVTSFEGTGKLDDIAVDVNLAVEKRLAIYRVQLGRRSVEDLVMTADVTAGDL